MKLADMKFGSWFVYENDEERQVYMKVDPALFVISHPAWPAVSVRIVEVEFESGPQPAYDIRNSLIPDCLIVNLDNGVLAYEFGETEVAPFYPPFPTNVYEADKCFI